MYKRSAREFIRIGLSLLAFVSSAMAENKHPCLFNKTGTVYDTLAFRPPAGLLGTDGARFTLTGLIAETFSSAPLRQTKKQAIEQFLSAQHHSFEVFSSKKAKRDRYNRQDVFVIQSSQTGPNDNSLPTLLLQETLLQKGLARFDPNTLPASCSNHLQAIETHARKTKKGLWKFSSFQPKQASDLHLAAIVSTYQIIEGTVKSVSRNPNGTSYLNFGRNWQTDFTITLSKKSLAVWEEENKMLDDLVNAPINVRGWIEDRGGPLIRVLRPQQLWVKTSLD